MKTAYITAASTIVTTCSNNTPGSGAISCAAGKACSGPNTAAGEACASPATGNAYVTASATASTSATTLSISGHSYQ
jgi:hypothetical protein